MVELDEPGRRATVAVLADERASGLLVLPHGTANVRGDCPGSRRLARPAGLVGRSELLPFELTDEGVQRAVEHRCDIARRAEEVLCVAQLVAGRLLDRHLKREALGGDRRHARGHLDLPRGR